jgi:hypothetical protein
MYAVSCVSCEQGQAWINHYWVEQPFSGFLESSSLDTIHNSWSLDRISWAFLQTLITNNLQIFSDIIKANKATALAIPK